MKPKFNRPIKNILLHILIAAVVTVVGIFGINTLGLVLSNWNFISAILCLIFLFIILNYIFKENPFRASFLEHDSDDDKWFEFEKLKLDIKNDEKYALYYKEKQLVKKRRFKKYFLITTVTSVLLGIWTISFDNYRNINYGNQNYSEFFPKYNTILENKRDSIFLVSFNDSTIQLSRKDSNVLIMIYMLNNISENGKHNDTLLFSEIDSSFLLSHKDSRIFISQHIGGTLSRTNYSTILKSQRDSVLLTTLFNYDKLYVNAVPSSLGLILRNNFIISCLFVLFLLQFTVRKRILKKQSWKKIDDVWYNKATGISALSVGGFGIVADNQDKMNNILKITTDSHYVDIHLLTIIYIVTILFIGLSYLFGMIGRASSTDENGSIPLVWFIPTFIFIWLGTLGVYSLLIDSIFLTLNAHLTG